jgi:3-hydroxyisobutyrate dehydrogenase
MLPNGEAVRSVYLDESTGVIAGVKLAAATSPVRKLIVECGTIESATILDVAKAAEEAERSLPQGSVLDFVDAPVSGGPNGAANGTLAFMVGTNRPDTVFERVKSMLVHMGNPNSIFLCGNVGAGTAFKVINNYISAIASLASSEALNIGVKLGLDPKRLTEVINASGGQTCKQNR